MPIDLDNMSEKELKDLRAKVDRAIATVGARNLANARRAAEEAAAQHGFSLNELMSSASSSKSAKSKSPAKFRNPEDPDQTWSGRGRQPGWIKSGLAGGKSLEDFAI